MVCNILIKLCLVLILVACHFLAESSFPLCHGDWVSYGGGPNELLDPLPQIVRPPLDSICPTETLMFMCQLHGNRSRAHNSHIRHFVPSEPHTC